MRPFKRRMYRRLLQKYGKKNGVIPSAHFDLPKFEIQCCTDKHVMASKKPTMHDLISMMDE
jgi:hypothetical protein